MKVWRRCLVKQSTQAFKEQVAPQQLSVGISGGCEIKILGAHLELERQQRLDADYAHVAIDVRNAHNSFDRRKAQAALDALAARDGSLVALAQGHGRTRASRRMSTPVALTTGSSSSSPSMSAAPRARPSAPSSSRRPLTLR